MDTKLTLKLDKHIIENAKKYAKEKKISLSKMVESYLNSITKESEEKVEITPFVESLSGVINISKEDYKEDYSDYLNEKYR
jgi:dsDNA-specific endonuclease/ATPase MutS2